MLGFAEGADDGEAVGSGEHAVEDDGGGVFLWGEEPGEGGVAVGLVVGAVALGLKVEEEALSEVFFVFDDGDERFGGWVMRFLWVWCAICTDSVSYVC